jgi:hypothetical protein
MDTHNPPPCRPRMAAANLEFSTFVLMSFKLKSFQISLILVLGTGATCPQSGILQHVCPDRF